MARPVRSELTDDDRKQVECSVSTEKIPLAIDEGDVRTGLNMFVIHPIAINTKL